MTDDHQLLKYLDDKQEDHQLVKYLDDKQEDDQCNGQKRKGGKRRIEMKPLPKKTSRQVTFTKRRNGLFKKASELCTLSGAEVAVIAFSGAGKLYSFGHPSADDVIRRYSRYSCLTVGRDTGGEHDSTDDNCNVDKISEEYKKVLLNINSEKKRTAASAEVAGSSSSNNTDGNTARYWWDVQVDDVNGLNELEQLKAALEGLRLEVAMRIDGFNRCSSMSVFPVKSEHGSSDGNVVARDCEDSAWNTDLGMAIPSVPPVMMNSFIGHAYENSGSFQ